MTIPCHWTLFEGFFPTPVAHVDATWHELGDMLGRIPEAWSYICSTACTDSKCAAKLGTVSWGPYNIDHPCQNPNCNAPIHESDPQHAATRCDPNVASYHPFVGDTDHKTSGDLDGIRQRVAPYSHYIHTTHGDGINGERAFRVVIDMSRPCLPHEIQPFRARVIYMLGLESDKATVDRSRYYNNPTCRKGGTPQFYEGAGIALDVDAILAMPDPPGYAPEAPVPMPRRRDDSLPVAGRGALVEMLAAIWRPGVFGRAKAAMFIAGTCFSAGWEEDEALNLFEKLVAATGESKQDLNDYTRACLAAYRADGSFGGRHKLAAWLGPDYSDECAEIIHVIHGPNWIPPEVREADNIALKTAWDRRQVPMSELPPPPPCDTAYWSARQSLSVGSKDGTKTEKRARDFNVDKKFVQQKLTEWMKKADPKTERNIALMRMLAGERLDRKEIETCAWHLGLLFPECLSFEEFELFLRASVLHESKDVTIVAAVLKELYEGQYLTGAKSEFAGAFRKREENIQQKERHKSLTAARTASVRDRNADLPPPRSLPGSRLGNYTGRNE